MVKKIICLLIRLNPKKILQINPYNIPFSKYKHPAGLLHWKGIVRYILSLKSFWRYWRMKLTQENKQKNDNNIVKKKDIKSVVEFQALIPHSIINIKFNDILWLLAPPKVMSAIVRVQSQWKLKFIKLISRALSQMPNNVLWTKKEIEWNYAK